MPFSKGCDDARSLGPNHLTYLHIATLAQVCRRELCEAKGRLRDQGRWIEEASAREQANAQVGGSVSLLVEVRLNIVD